MPLKIKNMKNIDYFSCASPASTAICSSTDQTSMIKNTTTKSSINRFNSLNPHSSSSSPKAPCISELPFTPRLSSSFREKAHKKPSPSPSPSPSSTSIVKLSDLTPRRKSSADVSDIRRRYVPLRTHSSRYLLSESKNNNNNINEDDGLAIVVSTPLYEDDNNNKSFGSFLVDEKEKKKMINKRLMGVNHDYYYGDKRVIKSSTNYDEDGQKNKQSSMGYSRNDSLVLRKSSSSGARSRDQVVVLRVSLHCKGCEGKLRKHLSKMEGVTSFSIDLETKKVTVIGKVTPLEVLTSISKVKNAQFWPSATSPSSSSSSSTSSSTLDF